jgi:hypothetical protein
MMLAWFFLWIMLGVFSLFLHNLALPYIFLIYAIVMYASHLYLACTRCHYFGRSCYLMGGLAAPMIFKARKQGPQEPDDSILSTLWLVLGIFPVPFLIYYQDWFWAVLYSVATYGWFYYRNKAVCSRCENGWCPNKK